MLVTRGVKVGLGEGAGGVLVTRGGKGGQSKVAADRDAEGGGRSNAEVIYGSYEP